MGTEGFSKAGLERMRRVLGDYAEREEVPGYVTLVARGSEGHVEAFGAAQRDTIFRIASMSKPVVAVAALTLVEEGRLRLDDPVDALLPELAHRRVLRTLESGLADTVPARRPITLRDLLTFRLGHGLLMAPPGTYPIQKVMDELGLAVGPPAPDEMPAPDEWLRRLGTLPLLHQPGERWMYHTGSEVLSVLIARAAGEPLLGFLRARIFEPLGMKDTGFYVSPEKIDRLATSYWTNFSTGQFGVYDEARGGQWSRPPAFPSGGGGLVSTADDYLAFAQMLMNKGTYGGERILSRAAVELMTMDHLTDAQKAVSGLTPGDFDAAGWGFGVGVVTRRTELAWSVGTYGWDGGLGTSWRNDPVEGLTGILLTQRMWTSPTPPTICRDFWTLTGGLL